jgi:FKBP-type peptidyl-prolyl cis-trans isomerase 2
LLIYRQDQYLPGRLKENGTMNCSYLFKGVKKIMKKIVVFIVVGIWSVLMLSCASMSDNASPAFQHPKVEGRGLEYTCRIQNGDILASTQEDIANSPENKKASAFIYKKVYQPVDITDYDARQKNAALKGQLKYLDEVLIDKLVQETKAWKPGDSGSIRVAAKSQNDLPFNERSIRLTKVKTHPKNTVYEKDIFTSLTGSNPAIGETVQLDTGIKGKVVSVENDEVKVAFEPISDQPLEGPFGMVTVKDMGDHFVTDIDARKGALVSVGPAVGQIAEVSKKNFLVDYAHPFGGETLQCDVKVVAIEKDMQPQESNARADLHQNEKSGLSAAAPATGKSSGLSTDIDKSVRVETGDMVKVAYTARLKSNGKIIQTTSADIAGDINRGKIKNFKAPDTLGPITVIAGAQEAFLGLGYAVMGLVKGEQKEVIISPDKAFGNRNPRLIRNFDRDKTVPTTITMSAKEYSKKYNGFPIKGKTILFNPYVEARIMNVAKDSVTLCLSPVAEDLDSDFGLTRMMVEKNKINIHLTPKIGGYFELEKRPGRVVAVSDNQFTVDFNEPLAGQDILFDVKILSLTKANEFSNMAIQWIEDYEKGMQTVEEMKKPAVLVLYAEWCHYCKKLMSITLVDPRIKMMKDDFVWIKVNSDKNKEFKQLYEQKGFPLTVLLDSQGEVIEKISGFRPAGEYQAELKKALKGGAVGSKIKAKTQMEKKAHEGHI